MKRTTQKMYAVLLTFVMLCGCLIIPTPATVEAAGNTKLKVTSAKTVVVGKTIKIKTNVKAKFKSSNKKIATVSSKGVVKGKKAGKVKITVTSKSNKKQKKVIKITVKKKPNTTVTTEKPTPSPNPKPTTEQPSVVKPTTETPTTEAPTTEKPTTEAPTTEAPTTEKPTTEAPAERKVVGIEANYRGSKVPNDLYMISILGADIRCVYNDGSKEKIINNEECSLKLINSTSNSATYEVKYKEFSTQFSVELFDTSKLYPYQLNVRYTGDPLEKGAIPKLEDLEATILMNDIETKIDSDKSSLKIIFIEDLPDIGEYEFVFVYDYTFKDENCNELFVSRLDRNYVPHK